MASAGSRQGSRNAATILEALGRRKQSEPLRRVQSVDQTTVPSLAMDRGGIARRTSSLLFSLAIRQHSMNMHVIPTGPAVLAKGTFLQALCRAILPDLQ